MSCIGLTVTRATLRRSAAHSPICARYFLFVLRHTSYVSPSSSRHSRHPPHLGCRAADEQVAFGQRRALPDEGRVRREEELRRIAGMLKHASRSRLSNRTVSVSFYELRQLVVIS